MTPVEITLITSTINNLRAKHGVPGLMYQPRISDSSQQWAEYLVSSGNTRKSGNKLYTENLIIFPVKYESHVQACIDAINAWYAQGENYNYNTTSFNDSALDFTCLIWKSSVYYGIGVASNVSKTIVVFNTTPIGNNVNTFMGNVKPPLL